MYAGIIDAVRIKPENVTSIPSKGVANFKGHVFSGQGVKERKTADQFKNIGLGGEMDALKTYLARLLNLSPKDNAGKPLFVGDAAPDGYAEMNTLQQFFTAFLPGIQIGLQAPLLAEQIYGMLLVGDITTEWMARRIVSLAGNADKYRDLTSGSLSLYRAGFEYRQTAKFQANTSTTYMKSQMQSASGFENEMLVDMAANMALQQIIERTHWLGVAGKLCYGVLNDPNANAITSVAQGAGSGSPTSWSLKTFLEILADVRSMYAELSTNNQGHFNFRKDAAVLTLDPATFNYITVPNTIASISVAEWLKQTYPLLEIEQAPYLTAAHSTANVAILSAKEAVKGDVSTDSRSVITAIACVLNYLLSALPNAQGGINKGFIANVGGGWLFRPSLFSSRYGV